MSTTSQSFSQKIRTPFAAALALAALCIFLPGAARATSITVGPGTLSWSVSSSSGTCLYGSTYVTYSFSSFSFKVGTTTTSLGGGATYTDSSCGNYGPPAGANPATITFSTSTFTIVFTPQDGGGGSATYASNAPPVSYTIYPAYKVVNVVYVPLGNKSYVGYTTTVTDGTTTKISDSYETTNSLGETNGFTLNIGATADMPKGIGTIGSSGGVNFGFSSTTGDTSSFTENYSSSAGVQFLSASDALAHNNDWIFVWLNPAVTVTQTAANAISYSLGVPANDIGTDANHTPVMDVVPATVSQLQNPTTLQFGQLVSSTQDGVTVPGLLCLCKNAVPAASCTAALAAQNGCGCAASDFADIVAQDPFFHSGVAVGSTPLQVNSVIPNRFAYVNTELLDFGVQSTYTIDDKTTTQTAYSTTNMDSVGFSNSNSFMIPPAFAITLKNANMWTWTDTMETTKTNTLDHTMTAFLNSTNAACYSDVDIYLDTVYHTYVFVPDSSSTSACP